MSKPRGGRTITWTWKGKPHGRALSPSLCATWQYMTADTNGSELCPASSSARPRKLCSRQWYSRPGSMPIMLWSLKYVAITLAFSREVTLSMFGCSRRKQENIPSNLSLICNNFEYQCHWCHFSLPTSSKLPNLLSGMKRSNAPTALASDIASPFLSASHSVMAMLRCKLVRTALA